MAVDTSAGTVTPLTGAEYLESHPGRPRDLGLRGAGRGRDDAPRVPQRHADGRADVRQAPRPRATSDVLTTPTDTGGGRFTHPFFRPPHGAEDLRRRPRRHRRVGPHELRLDGSRARLQGRVPRHPRRQRRLLRPVPGQREALVQGRAGALPVLQPRDHQPAHRPPEGRRRGARRLHPRRARDGRGRGHQRGEGRGDRLGADALQLHRPLRGRADQDEGLRGDLRRADGRAGREAHLPPVVLVHGGGHGQPVRLPAVQPARRERLGDDLRRGPRPVGEPLRLRRRRQDQRASSPPPGSSRASRSTAARGSR